METAEVDIAIIGGGVIGLAIGYYLTQEFPAKAVALFEKNKFLGEEQSGRNSGVVHAGHLYRPGTKKAGLCLRGNKMLASFAQEQKIPYQRTGKITVATIVEEEKVLEFYLQQSRKNGVDDTQIISAVEIKKMEPNVTARCALYTPTTGIIDAAAYVRTLESLLCRQGGYILKEAEVVAIAVGEKNNNLTILQKENGKTYAVKAEYLINAAGLESEIVGKKINPNFPYVIKPHRGNYLKFNKNRHEEIAMSGLNVYPVPQPIPGLFNQDGKPKMMVGTHLTPTFEYVFEGNNNENVEIENKERRNVRIGRTVLVGPLACQDGQNGKSPTKKMFLDEVIHFFPGLKEEDLEEEMTSIQVKIAGYDDFVIERDRMFGNCIHVIADSPGLTASLAIAEKVIKILRNTIW